jgi:hypothetical protein
LKQKPPIETIVLDDNYLYAPAAGPTFNNQWVLLFKPNGLEEFQKQLIQTISF